MLINKPHAVLPTFNIFLLAFCAEGLENLLHEATHAIMTLLVGAKVKTFSFWAVDSGWPEGSETVFGAALIAGGAALFNIVCAGISILLFSKLRVPPLVKLFIFYFAAYSLFSGFGYLFFDPLFASSESIGDWGKVVMLLGGGLEIRSLICLIGALGTVYGYFWMGSAALSIVRGQVQDENEKRKYGLLLLVYPYITVNLLFSLLAMGHPLGIPGFFAMLLKLWFGFVGFFWAYMIKFIWIKTVDDRHKTDVNILEPLHTTHPRLFIGSMIAIILIIYPFSQGLSF